MTIRARHAPILALLVPLVIVASLAAAAARRQAPGQAPPVFRSGAELVQVDVSVLDGKRAPVKGLTAANFTVLENGVARPVEAFAAIDLPDHVVAQGAAWTRDIPPDVAVNRTGEDEGRIVVILMDRTIPLGTPVTTARKIASAAVDALGPGDLAALVSTSGGVPQNLTSDRNRLIRAINQRDWSTDISDEAKASEAAVGISPDIFNSLTDGRCLCGLCVLHTITNVASALEQMPRRQKSLLFIGASIILQAGPQDQRVEMGCGQKLADARTVMWGALDRSGVRVYSVDPSGLEATLPTGQTMPTFRGSRPPDPFAGAVQEHLNRQGSLFVLPDRTGGRVVTSTNAPETRVPDIMHESASYYLLGYRPAEPQVPGQARKIEVKVDQRNVSVSARREYLVPAASASPVGSTRTTLGSAISSPLPATGGRLAMTASAFALPGSKGATVAVTLDLSGFAGRVSIAIGSFDSFGKPVTGIERVVTLPTLSPAALAAGAPLEAIVQLVLPPGDQELRAAVVADEGARPASVFTSMTVPQFATLPFSLSHIVLAAVPGTVTVTPDKAFDLLPVVPTTRRDFVRSANVVAFLRVYQGSAKTSALAPVTVTASVVDRDGKVRLQQAREFKTAEFDSARSADAGFALPLSALEPGEYLLSIQGVLGPRVAGRAVRFSVK
jgi:VWFA-related protein